MFFQNVYKGANDPWRYLLTILGTLAGLLFIGQIPVTIPVLQAYFKGDISLADIENFQANPDFTKIGIDANVGMFLLLMTFVIALIILLFLVQIIHRRSWRSLINYKEQFNWSKIGFAFGLWFLMSLVPEAINYGLSPESYSYQLNWSKFLPLLAISIFILPLQTSFEEIFMRGYLLQAFGYWTGTRLIPLLVTSAIFGLMHGMNPEVGKFGFGTMMFYYIGTGLFLGIITLMDDSLELALGVHAATNIYASTIVTFEGSALQTPAIFKTEIINIELMIPVFFAFAALFTFICARKYDWSDWSKLYAKIPPEEQAEIEVPLG